jgi:hypothetical protein
MKSFKVTLGIQRLSGKSDSRHVMYSKKKVLHKNFDPDMLDNDIALLKLPKKVKLGLNNPLLSNEQLMNFFPVLGKFINTVRLPSVADSSNTFLGIQATASGWGFTSDSKHIAFFFK